MQYSGDLNSKLVWYSNDSKYFAGRMAHYLGPGLNREVKVCYSRHGLNNELIFHYSGHRLVVYVWVFHVRSSPPFPCYISAQ